MIVATHITVTTTPIKLVDGPALIFLQSASGGVVLGDATVTPTSGYSLNLKDPPFEIKNHDALYAVTSSGSVTVEALIFS